MQIYKNWLTANGVKFEEMPFGLTFKYQGASFILFDNSTDKLYLNLSMPNIWDVDGQEVKVLRVANKINCEIKAIKVTLRNNAVWLNIEMFIDNTPDVEDFMERILGIMLECRMKFAFEMHNS